MPSSKRPPVSADSVCASQAASLGARSVLASTNVPTRSDEVAPAASASAGSGDHGRCRPSAVSSVEYPSSSARLAVASHCSPSCGTARTANLNDLAAIPGRLVHGS